MVRFDGGSGATGVQHWERGSLYTDEVELDLSLGGPTGGSPAASSTPSTSTSPSPTSSSHTRVGSHSTGILQILGCLAAPILGDPSRSHGDPHPAHSDLSAKRLQTEQNAWLEFDDAMSRRLTLLDALADAEGDECRSCPNYIGAVHLHVAAERMFQQARDAENNLYLEFLRCDSDACWNRIEDRLDEEAVPRKADAAQRLHDAQQRMLDAEAAFHSEMEDSFQ